MQGGCFEDQMGEMAIWPVSRGTTDYCVRVSDGLPERYWNQGKATAILFGLRRRKAV
jgi:hypothetical protein